MSVKFFDETNLALQLLSLPTNLSLCSHHCPPFCVYLTVRTYVLRVANFVKYQEEQKLSTSPSPPCPPLADWTEHVDGCVK